VAVVSAGPHTKYFKLGQHEMVNHASTSLLDFYRTGALSGAQSITVSQHYWRHTVHVIHRLR